MLHHVSKALFILLALVVSVPALLPAKPAAAIYHIAYIDEVMAGFDGDPNVQFIDIRMDFPGQHLVSGTRLTVWNADGSIFTELMVLPDDVPNDGTNVHWIMATQEFANLTGMTPDFIMPAGIITPTGMVCWGGPDWGKDASEWDPQFPFLYTDCVAYGGYTGGNSIHPPPSSQPPGDGTRSLTRILPEPPSGGGGEAAHLAAPPDEDSFALRCPRPENNAGEVVLMGDDSDGDTVPDCHEQEALVGGIASLDTDASGALSSDARGDAGRHTTAIAVAAAVAAIAAAVSLGAAAAYARRRR